MKRLLTAALTLLLVLLFPCRTVHALTFTDNMTDMDSGSIKSYSGLVPVSAASGYPGAIAALIPGQNALTLGSGAALGWVDYRVQGAETLTVGIYTRRGTFVSQVPQSGAWALGVCLSDMSYLQNQQVSQAQLSRSSGTVYARAGGSLRSLTDSLGLLEFLETSDIPSDLIDYGVNVYAGPDAASLSRVSLAVSSRSRLEVMQYGSSPIYCYEELSWQLPTSTRYVRVELNDYSRLDTLRTGQVSREPVPTGMRTTLSFVRLQGSALQMGAPQPLTSESSAQSLSESAGGSVSTSSRASSSRSSASSASSPASSSSSAARGAASKFQGEIYAASSSGASSARTGGSSAAPVESGTTSVEVPQSVSAEHARAQVFHVEPRARAGVSLILPLYIVGICGLIVLLLLRGRSP